MKNNHNYTAREVHEMASDEANKYTEDTLRTAGEDPMSCGFAWVIIHENGNSRFIRDLVNSGAAHKAYGGGYQVWNPSGHYTQDMHAKYEGAQAYARVLKSLGYDATAHCRYD